MTDKDLNDFIDSIADYTRLVDLNTDNGMDSLKQIVKYQLIRAYNGGIVDKLNDDVKTIFNEEL